MTRWTLAPNFLLCVSWASRLSLLAREVSEAANRLLNEEAKKLYEARAERERSAAEAAAPKPAQRSVLPPPVGVMPDRARLGQTLQIF